MKGAPGILVAILAALLLTPSLVSGQSIAKSEIKFGPGGHATIPFDLRNQHLWIRGRLNGSDSIWIVVDTGASASVMDEGTARRLSIPLTRGFQAHGAAGMQRGYAAESVTVELPGLKLHRPVIGTLDLSGITQSGGRPMQLILGYELFESSVVRFDYARGLMEVWAPGRAPKDLPGTKVPMTLVQNHPYVEATLHIRGRPALQGRFVIDSGSSGALFIAPEITAEENLVSAFPRTLVAIGRGVGGEVRNREGRADSLSIGGLTFKRPVVSMPGPSQGRISAVGSIGNIGGQILGRCAVTFDYAGKSIYLEPGPEFDRPFEGDMSGASFARTQEGLVVRWVNPDSPAAQAGLVVGDKITQVDDQPANTIDPSALRLQMREEGRTVRLRIRRGSETFEKAFTLRRLI